MSKWPQWLRGLCDLRVTLKNTSASWKESFYASLQNKHLNWNKWVNLALWACQAFFRSPMPRIGGLMGRDMAGRSSPLPWAMVTPGLDRSRPGHQTEGWWTLLGQPPPIPVQHAHPSEWKLDSKRSGISIYPTPTPPIEVSVSWEQAPIALCYLGHDSDPHPHGRAPDLGSPSTHHGSCPPGKWTPLTFIIWIMLIHKAENGVTLIFLYVKWSCCNCELLINLCSQLCIFPCSHSAQSELLVFQKAWDGCPPKTIVSMGKEWLSPFG